MIIPESMHGHVLLHRFCFRGGRQTYSNILTSNEKNQNVEEEMPIFSNLYCPNPWGDSFIAVQSDLNQSFGRSASKFLRESDGLLRIFKLTNLLSFRLILFRSFQINLFLYNILREMSVFQIGSSPSPSLLRAWSG